MNGRDRPQLTDLRTAMRSGGESGLDALAQPLPEEIGDEALVAPPKLRDELELLWLRCRHRDRLAADLGISARARYAPGVRALFTGPSGTGKTLAASWLATRLGLPLYRVDLASVTSKYIGETEKNLAELLNRAERAGVILLFDEADSMFGKRTDIKDSHDRYANAQTNYLLQRIESFDGIALLTSNSRQRFDSAFARRLDAIIDFPLPGSDERCALWLAHLGDGHTLSAQAVRGGRDASTLPGTHPQRRAHCVGVGAGRRSAHQLARPGSACRRRIRQNRATDAHWDRRVTRRELLILLPPPPARRSTDD
ncbi:MAG: ATP-binding protein [Caldilineaceae bacterium]